MRHVSDTAAFVVLKANMCGYGTNLMLLLDKLLFLMPRAKSYMWGNRAKLILLSIPNT